MKQITIAFILFLGGFNLLAQEPTIDRQPNVILIMADDLGREAVGCYGGTSYQTPTLDQLAQTGARFEHAYAYPLCTPTRVALMTGKYNYRNWKAFGILDPNEKTFGHLLQNVGYKTCMVGKWQLQSYDPIGYPGAELRRNTGMRVENAGFDEYCMWHVAHTENKGSRYPDPVIYQNGQFLRNTNNKYGPDIFTDYLIDFIERHRDRPFFAYYPMALTHGPFNMSPDNPQWSDHTLRHKSDTQYFKDMVEYTDKLMDKILNKLTELGIRENTLFVFYSDNGTHQSIYSMQNGTKVKGGKGLPNDAGTRVPMFVEWKGTIKPGQLSHQFIDPNDFIPTIFDAIQKDLPNDFVTDGQSFLAELIGKSSNRRDWVMIDHNPRPGWDKENFGRQAFVKGERYKLYRTGEFYDVESDKIEQSPLQNLTPKQQQLKEKYQNILDSLKRYRTFGKIQSLDSSFNKIVPPHTEIEIIAEGFTWSEGPVWVEDKQMLLFSDVPRNTIYQWSETDGIKEFLHPSGYSGNEPGAKGSNGLTLDNKGKLLICRTGDHEVARLASSFDQAVPVYQSIATHFEGKWFNSPNDIICDQEGNIYFTDPPFGNIDDFQIGFNGVFKINMNGTIDLITKELERPNGIGLSPDEKTLYVANSNPPALFSYDLTKSKLPIKGKKIFDARKLVNNSISKQKPDGMAINKEGTIFLAGPDGVLVLAKDGKHLGTIFTGKKTSNCVLNEDETVLYITCDDYILRVVMGYKLGFAK